MFRLTVDIDLVERFFCDYSFVPFVLRVVMVEKHKVYSETLFHGHFFGTRVSFVDSREFHLIPVHSHSF